MFVFNLKSLQVNFLCLHTSFQAFLAIINPDLLKPLPGQNHQGIADSHRSDSHFSIAFARDPFGIIGNNSALSYNLSF